MSAAGIPDKGDATVNVTEPRRRSIFDSLRGRKSVDKGMTGEDSSSMLSSNTTHSRFPLLGGKSSSASKEEKEKKKKEKRESMSERGAFRIEVSPEGVPYCVENKDWPPGVNYKVSSQIKQFQRGDAGLGSFYEKQGAIVPGGETAGNVGPDPDWVPGLTEEQRKKLRDDKSGKYGKFGTFYIQLYANRTILVF